MKITLFLIGGLVAWVHVAFAQTAYYVSLSGNDANSGLSIAEAWRTIQHAMDQATPGSTVYILAGTYNEKVTCNVSGTAGQPITFRNYQNDVVTISGAGISTQDAVVAIYDQSYVIIEGLNIQDNEQLDAQGILVEGACTGIEIRNNHITNIHFSSNPNAPATPSTNAQPLIVYGTDGANPVSDLVIEGNTINHCRTGYSEGLAINGNVDGFVLRNNTVYDITNIGIDLIGHEGTAPANDQARNGTIEYNTVFNCKSPYATAAGIYVDGARDLVIEHNTIYQCQWGIEIGCENIGQSASVIVVRNNLIYDNDDAGLAVGGYDYPGGSGKVVNCTIRHNTLYDNDKSSGGVGGVTGEVNITYTEQCTLSHNIIYATNGAHLVLFVDNVGSVGLALDYNLYYFSGNAPEFEYEGTTYTSLAAYQSATGQDAHALYADPAFDNAAAYDLHIGSSSPAFNAGDPAFSPASGETDMDGEARVLNGTVDIGADEHNVMTPVEWLEPLQAFPRGEIVVVKWATATEDQTDHFLVERSPDAVHWTPLASVPARRFSATPQWYEWHDSMPLPGESFYRLRRVDADGSYSWSPVVRVWREALPAALHLWPVPATDVLMIDWPNPRRPFAVEIFDLAGRCVEALPAKEGRTLQLDVGTLAPGVYVLRVCTPEGRIVSGRFVKR